MDYNHQELIGRLVSDGETRKSDSGTTFYNNAIAVDRSYKVNGESVTDFHRIAAIGKKAELVSSLSRKGAKVLVTGEHIINKDKENPRIEYHELQIDTFIVLSPRNGGANASGDQGQGVQGSDEPSDTQGGGGDAYVDPLGDE